MGVADRVDALFAAGVLGEADARLLKSGRPTLPVRVADKMIENVIGTFGLPFAIAPNFRIDGRDYLVPMVVEEPSIVAGLSGAAKLARQVGGFSTRADESLLAGQIQLAGVADPDAVMQSLDRARTALKELADRAIPGLVERGGGCRDIELHKHRLPDGRWAVMMHVLVDTCDAMGANAVNTLCERLAPAVEKLAGARAVLRILSNLADRSLVAAEVTLPLDGLAPDGFDAAAVRDDIVLATATADADPHRAATHNKGIMNGVDAVAIATGNDWRAIEAAAHAYAARDGRYRSLSEWTATADGRLHGRLVLPLKVGIVGGSLRANPGAGIGLRIAGVDTAAELGALMAAVGLAQNFAALKALVTHGIQRGHMRLHARSVAATAGVSAEHFDAVVQGLVDSGEVKTWKAQALSRELGAGRDAGTASAVDVDGAATGTAAGKVILLGEHAAVYDKRVLALPLADAVRATVAARDDGMRLTLDERGTIREIALDDSTDRGIAAALNLILEKLAVDSRGFSIHVESRIPAAMGLGSSAAFVVAIIRALDRYLALGLGDRDVDSLAFECEKLAHGTPSGIDNNLATYGQPVLYSKSSANRTKPITLAEAPPIVVASSGIRGATREQVEAVRSRFERNSALYTTIFDEIDEISVAGAVALRNCDYDTLGALMNVCHGFLNAIEVSIPELERMVQIARQAGAVGAKLTGAGGGGSIVALCPGSETAVADALAAEGHAVIRLAQDRRRNGDAGK